MPTGPSEVRDWSSTAQYWEKHRDVIRDMFAPVAQALIDASGIAAGIAAGQPAGYSVLDVASGPGEPALSIAALVGPHGRVAGVDLAPEMAEAARRAAAAQGLSHNTQFEAASAEHLPFPDASFDAAVCRFGVMFFPSPVDGVREMLRVLKPGAKLAFAAWHHADVNPFLSAVSDVIGRYFETPPPAPDAADTFRFASLGKLRDVVAAAGAVDVSERLLEYRINAPVSLDEFWTLRTEMSEKLRDMLATLSGDRLAQVKRESLDAVRKYSTGDGMSFPSQVVIVSGRRSRMLNDL